MKRKFSYGAAVVLGLMLFIIGCSNSSQLTFQRDSEQKFTDDGLSTLTLSLGDVSRTERVIFPDDWKDELKGKLVYRLTGTKHSGETTDPIVEPFKTSGKDFTYEELIAGNAKVSIDPINWDFTLTAYQAKAPTGSTLEADPTKPVLVSDVVNKDLTAGHQPATFNLKPVVNDTSTGQVALTVKFYDSDTPALKSVEVKIVDKGTPSTVIATSTPQETFSAIGTNPEYKKVVYQDPAVKPGDHLLQVVFINADDKTVAVHEERIVVDGGNLTTGVINIPQGSFNSKPADPSEFKAETYFMPTAEAERVAIEGSTIFGQQITDISKLEKNYKLHLSWKDNAYNEEGYIITLTGNVPDENVTLTTNTADHTTVDVVDTKSVGVAVDDKIANNNLVPGATELTLNVPTGKFFNKVTIKAINGIGESTEVDLASPIGSGDAIGMFTVAYQLEDDQTRKGFVKYGAGEANKTKEKFYVHAYNFNKAANTKLLGIKGYYPFVGSDKGHFGGWLKDKANPADGKEAIDKLANENITVYASWLSTISVEVNYPSYSGYKNLHIVEEENPSELVIPKDDANGTLEINIPADTEYADPVFEIYKNGSTTAIAKVTNADMGITIAGKNLTWETKKFTSSATGAGGVYRIHVKYTYTPTTPAGANAEVIDGNLYVKLTK